MMFVQASRLLPFAAEHPDPVGSKAFAARTEVMTDKHMEVFKNQGHNIDPKLIGRLL